MNPTEPRPQLARPRAPAWLSKDAKKVYYQVADHLVAVGVLTEIDGEALARYARLVVRYRRHEAFLEKHGDVYPVRGKRGPDGKPGDPIGFRSYPQTKIAGELADALLRLEHEFGLTPASRARIPSEAVEQPFSGGGTDFFGLRTG